MNSEAANHPNRPGIIQIICEKITEIEPENHGLTESSDLSSDVHIDSASTMMLVFDLEEQFDVSVPLNDLADIRTIGDLADLVLKLQPSA